MILPVDCEVSEMLYQVLDELNIFFCKCFSCVLLQVSGKYNAIFEAYLQKMDPKSTGVIEAMAAATFLKKSGLSDVVLSRVSVFEKLNCFCLTSHTFLIFTDLGFIRSSGVSEDFVGPKCQICANLLLFS